MRLLMQAAMAMIVLTAHALAQEADPDAAARLDALTCSTFLGLNAEEQVSVMLALRAHMNGEPLPSAPLPAGVVAEGGADSGQAGPGVDEAQQGEGAAGDDPPDETGIIDAENESGQVNPDGTEASVSGASADPKLTAMRTSCEGGPQSLASDAMRAAHADAN